MAAPSTGCSGNSENNTAALVPVDDVSHMNGTFLFNKEITVPSLSLVPTRCSTVRRLPTADPWTQGDITWNTLASPGGTAMDLRNQRNPRQSGSHSRRSTHEKVPYNAFVRRENCDVLVGLAILGSSVAAATDFHTTVEQLVEQVGEHSEPGPWRRRRKRSWSSCHAVKVATGSEQTD